MIKSVHDYQIDDVFKKDASFYYLIPKYQREYTWSINQWKDLYDDIGENEYGYFIGSIICIDTASDAFCVKPLEVVDGQQRLTTLSLLLAAIYCRLKGYRDQLDDDDLEELTSLRKSLLCKEAANGLILCPQIQNFNHADFMTVMAEAGLIKNVKKEKNWGLRRIAKSYRYFLQRLDQDIEKSSNPITTLLEIKRKIAKAILVKIEVGSHAEAYTLFESLNNRGTPLTAIDLMKNLILAKAEKAKLSCDECFENWQTLLLYLTDDYATQERFFRQYYNAFKNRLNKPFRDADQKKKDPLGYIATRSNLLSIYEELIAHNLPEFIEDILLCGEMYSQFILSGDETNKYTIAFKDLSRIQGTPSYLLLLYLFRHQQDLALTDSQLLETIKVLTRFFVRRNITDIPNTRDLTHIFMSILDDIEEQEMKGQSIFAHVQTTLADKSASDEVFATRLSGDIYEENVGAARFVLCAVAQKGMTTETWTDLWEQSIGDNGKKVYKWTIEHVFPEGKNIPQCWVDMIANGNRTQADEYQTQYVHKLGNLTVTRYNSTLSNLSFEKKRDRMKDGLFVGYKNGLEINRDIAEKDTWTIEDIQQRTQDLTQALLQMYKL